MNKTLIAFLTRIPNDNLIKIAKELSDYHDIYIFVDDNSYICEKNTKINYIQIDNDLCIKNGYKYTMECFYYNILNDYETDIKISSFDKFFYYFCNLNLDYEYIWMIEDDVFIPHINSLLELEKKSLKYDLVCAKDEMGTIDDAKNNKWFWSYAILIFGDPSYCSMVCCARLSKKLILNIKEVILKLKFIPYLEFLCNTVAHRYNLTILCPNELSTIVYRNDWTIEDFKKNPCNLFHPFKKFELHDVYRKEINLLK